jgi:hypothetical protein
VRDTRAVSWSAVKKAKRRGARPLLAMRCAFATACWWIANLGCELFGQNPARSPSEAMRDLFAKLLPGSACAPTRSEEAIRGTSSMALRLREHRARSGVGGLA